MDGMDGMANRNFTASAEEKQEMSKNSKQSWTSDQNRTNVKFQKLKFPEKSRRIQP